MTMKIGMIGCGNISPAYLTYLGQSEFARITAVADLLPEKARERAEQFAIENVYTVEELLGRQDIDMVLNLTVPSSHAAVNMAALAHGKHVYVEKPLAISLEDARSMLEQAAAKNLRVGCAPDTFLGAGIETSRKAIADGLIGRPVAATAFMMGGGPESWHPNPEFFYAEGGGPMFDMGPYYLTAFVEPARADRAHQRLGGQPGSRTHGQNRTQRRQNDSGAYADALQRHAGFYRRRHRHARDQLRCPRRKRPAPHRDLWDRRDAACPRPELL